MITLAFSIDGLDSTLRVVRVEGREGISELYAFRVDVLCDDGALSLGELVGARAALRMDVDGRSRVVHGIVGKVEQADDLRDDGAYTMTLVPSVRRMELRHDCRVFAETTVPEILKTVLSEAAGQKVRFDLRDGYPVIEHAIQYRESDWSFVSRLMEAEGIFYFFEHRDQETVLVIADGPHAHPGADDDDTVPFRNASGGLLQGEYLSRFRFAEELRADRVALRGHSFKNPALPLEAGAEAPGGARIEVYEDLAGAEPVARPEPGVVDRRAQRRLEQLQVDRSTARALASTPRLPPGHAFVLSGHPREAFNRRYLVTHVDHLATSPSGDGAKDAAAEPSYRSELSCIPFDVPFRPSALTPRPRIEGTQTARVVGPRGEEIFTDELGRVRIEFPWDRRSTHDDKSSFWVRVAQSWAGSGWGSIHIPRVGQEVLVDFLGGDLDRPVIVGGLYHATNVPPYALPAGRTISGFKTSSTPGGQGSNELRFEDAAGVEEVYLHAERDLSVMVEQDASTTVGRDDALAVEGERTKRVGHNETVGIGQDKNVTIGGARSERIGGARKVEVGSGDDLVVGGDRTGNVTGSVTEVVGKNMSLTVAESKSERVHKSSAESVGGDKSVAVEGNMLLDTSGSLGISVSGSSTEEVEQEKTVVVGTRMHFVCGQGRITVERDGTIVISGQAIEIRSENPLKLEGANLSVKSSGAVRVRAEGPVSVAGGRVNMN